MNSNRRDFIVRSSLAVAAGAIGSPQALRAAASGRLRHRRPSRCSRRLRRNVGTFTARGGTMGWLVGPDAVVVIDSQFADTSKMFLDGFKPMIGGRKIDLLINTHHHPDHTGGNKVLQPSVTKIVAQENAPGCSGSRLRRTRARTTRRTPDTTYKTDWKIDLRKRGRVGASLRAGSHGRRRRHLLPEGERRAYGRSDVSTCGIRASIARRERRSGTGSCRWRRR